MKRRRVTGLLGALCCGARGPARAQPQRIARLGVLGTLPPSVAVMAPLWSAFYDEIAARGWNEGRNLVITARYNEGRPERDAALTAELLTTFPEVVLATNSGAIEAPRMATHSIPIYYGADLNEAIARTVGFIDRFLRGGRPADLPIEQPARLEFTVNQRTAQAIGLTLPAGLPLRATRVIA
ncbi:MAG TPA: hypothetical protein VLE45_05530 [Burkholderiaceae bacterium]|nr:hypothetical protein [Burkholderiaceae bacterium]